MSVWPQSLRGRVIAVTLAATFVALAVAMAALAIYDAQAYRRAISADLTTQADILARTTAPALAFDDPGAAGETLALMQARPDIISAVVYRASGEVFARYVSADLRDAASPAIPEASGIVIESGRIVLTQPIVDAQEVLGTLQLSARYDVAQRLGSYLIILFSVMLASLCVALLVSAFLQTRITNPIRSMTGVVRRVMEERDFSLRVSRSDTREMNVLVDAFNEMLVEVGTQTAALASSNRSLQGEMNERKAAEEALRATDRNKDQFLATLAHELRNPLAPLLNGITLLRLPPGPRISAPDLLNMMERQIRQMVRLIDDLMDVSRIKTNKLVLRTSEMDLNAAIRTAVETLAPYLAERRQELHLQLPETPLYIEGDATRLAQVFGNLLHNAAKFSAPGGRISLSLASSPDGIEVAVRDSGIGISREALARIFTLFEQADQSLERAQAGLGVGLSLAQRLVELHGGTVVAQSDGPGTGSTFVVRLPNRLAPPHHARARENGGARASGRALRVLVVDDNQDFATSLALMIRSMGSDVEIAFDGSAGLEAARRTAPQIAFIDIGMPGMNGYDLAAQLRRVPELADSVFVAVTGWGQVKDRQRASEAGFDFHLTKPVAPGDIEAVLKGQPVFNADNGRV